MTAAMTYLAIARMAYLREAYYRFELLFSALRAVVFVLVLAAVWHAVYSERPSIAGLTLTDVILYTCVAATLTMVFDVNLEREIGERLRSGNLALQLLKPVSYLLYGFAEGSGTMAYTATFTAVPTFAALLLMFGPPQVPALELAAALPMALLGFLLFFAFCHLTALTTYFTTEAWGVELMRATIVRFFAGGFVPLAFFPDALYRAALWLPFPYMIYFPALALSGQLPAELVGRTLLVQAAWGVVLLAANVAYFRVLVRRVTIHGG